ncbi:metallophosphoesterase [Chondromyces crocatus]|uniref:NACHT domain-containing protein n=1 Tax=Chondromyces crocatus TaxID=52 RepID=A0A0K1EAU1_CHOCO|nr:metallophosphoesterase [Chondromyces crocatus]AKT37797.1 uncharacterized protein CMC5_019390 [Chondromyces crocatus]
MRSPEVPPDALRTFTTDYRERVTDRHAHVRLLGLPPELLHERDLRGIQLDHLFVPLRFVHESGHLGHRSLDELLSTHRSVVVLGDPGMGKTTLLLYLSLVCAGLIPLTRPALEPRVPLFISLRELTMARTDTPDLRFIDHLARSARADLSLPGAHDMHFDAMLRLGQAIVLLDGLDEVGSTAARDRLAQDIRAFQTEYPRAPIWVTSRIHGYTPDIALPSNRFEHVRIASLQDDQIEDFLARWYGIQIPDSPGQRTEQRESLRRAIFRTPGVRRLAGNPLLLTVIAFIHQVVGDLPQDRGRLYEQCIEMLLRSWLDAKRGPADHAERHPFEHLRLHQDRQKDYLAHLALHIQSHPWKARTRLRDDASRGLIDRDEALECLAQRHLASSQRARPHLDLADARDEMRQFLDFIGDRAGLLLERGGGKLSFLHLSFQEYLAAWAFTCAPLEHDNPAFFVKHLGDPAWEEVLLLRLYVVQRRPGGGGDTAFDTIVSALFRSLEKTDAAEGWLTLTRALRDDLEFTARDCRQILDRAVTFWTANPAFFGAWFTALEEVKLFSDVGAKTLAEVLADKQREAPATDAVACLHLEMKLWGLTTQAVDRIRANRHLPELLPHLAVLLDEPELAPLLSEGVTDDVWAAVFAALNGPALYRLTLAWATGARPSPAPAAVRAAIVWMLSKVGDEAASRLNFAATHPDSGLLQYFSQATGLHTLHRLCKVTVPLAGGVSMEPPPGWTPRRPLDTTVHCALLGAARLVTRLQNTDTVEQAAARFLAGWGVTRVLHAPAENSPPTSATHDLAHRFVRHFTHEFSGSIGKLCQLYENQATVDSFGTQLLAEFGRHVGRHVGPAWSDELDVSPAAPAPFRPFSLPRIWLLPDMGDGVLHAHLESQSSLPLLFSSLGQLAACQHLVCFVRYQAARRSDALSVDETTDSWLRHHPLDAQLVAWSWQQHAEDLQRHRGSLRGLEGALALAHAQYAHLMTGLRLDGEGSPWRRLLDGREPGLEDLLDLRRHERVPSEASPSSSATASSSATVSTRTTTPTSHPAPEPLPSPPTLRTEREPLLTWLHVSDVHFGHPTAAHRADQKLVLAKLKADAATFRELGLPRIDAIFVTGDIAWSAQPEQYARAKDWLQDLAGAVRLDLRHVFAVPGNHDVDRQVDRDRATRRLLTSLREGSESLDEALDEAQEREQLTQRQSAYFAFARDLSPACLGAPTPASSRLWWHTPLEGRDGLRVRLIGLNSALLAADNQDQGKLRMGRRQLAETLAEPPSEADELLVVLSHHPATAGWLADQRDVDRELRSVAHLHLAGHVHEHDSEGLWAGGGNGIVRVVAGATHGDPARGDANAEHGYSFGALVDGADGFLRARIYPRRFSDKNRDFRADTENVPKGQSYAEHTIPRLRWR